MIGPEATLVLMRLDTQLRCCSWCASYRGARAAHPEQQKPEATGLAASRALGLRRLSLRWWA